MLTEKMVCERLTLQNLSTISMGWKKFDFFNHLYTMKQNYMNSKSLYSLIYKVLYMRMFTKISQIG